MKYILIFIVTILFRFIYLDVIPVSLAHDETDNIIQAHSVIQTGHDIVGNWAPFDFLPNSGVMAELSPLINVPALSVLPNNLFSAHFTTALLSSIFPILLLYWLTLIGIESSVALVTGWLLAISPWHILFSRTVLEQPTSLFFYLLSWIFLSRLILSYKLKSSNLINLLLFTFTYAIGFFTYHGYKFSLPLLTSILVIWHFWNSPKKNIRILLIFPSLVIVGLMIRTAIYSNYYASRGGELLFSNTVQYEKIINEDRRISLSSGLLKSIYSNKPLKLIQNIRDKYVRSFDSDMLYLHGESNGVFSTWKTGYLYLATLPFLLAGIGYLLLTHNKDHLLILTLLLFSPIASIIHVNNTVAFRSGIYFVLLNIVTAYGLVQVGKQMKVLSHTIQYTAYSIFGFVLICSLSYFCYIYYYVSPVTNASAYFYGDRLVANYVRLNPSSKTLLIVNQPRYLYSAITLTSDRITRNDVDNFKGRYSPSDLDEYHHDNLSIVKNCKEVTGSYDTIIISKNILDDQGGCDPLIALNQKVPKAKVSSLVSPLDSGEEYRIVGDTLCENYELRSYVHPTTHADFRLEQMNEPDFCVKWVVRQ